MSSLIRRKEEYWYVSGSALKEFRLAAGLSQRALADMIKAATGLEIAQQTISNAEHEFETPFEKAVAFSMAKIFS